MDIGKITNSLLISILTFTLSYEVPTVTDLDILTREPQYRLKRGDGNSLMIC